MIMNAKARRLLEAVDINLAVYANSTEGTVKDAALNSARHALYRALLIIDGDKNEG